MKAYIPLVPLLLLALLLFSCSAITPRPSGQELIGYWIDHRANTAFNLNEDGTYERSSKMYSDKGTWDVKGNRLILKQEELHAGFIPKKPPLTIKFEIAAITSNSVSLKIRDTVTTYTKRH